jgi:hypothetical protein
MSCNYKANCNISYTVEAGDFRPAFKNIGTLLFEHTEEMASPITCGTPVARAKMQYR